MAIKIRKVLETANNCRCKVCRANSKNPKKIFYRVFFKGNRDVPGCLSIANHYTFVLCGSCLKLLFEAIGDILIGEEI